MNAAQIHPEDLIDRSRHGHLGDDEQRLLQRHLAQCPACRFELAIAPGLYTHVALERKDQALISGVIARMARVKRAEHRTGGGRRALSMAAVFVAFLTGAAAASAGVQAWRQHKLAQVTIEKLRSSRVVTPVTRAITPAPLPLPVVVASSLAPTSEPQRRSRDGIRPPRRAAEPRAVAEVMDDACAPRFRRANELRRAGAATEALRGYRELRRGCAGSSEELSSRVLIGRIYLDQLDEPELALSAFDSYLAASDGALREDGMIGRALALARLHRLADEAVAWRVLLSAFPDSLYAGRAQARLRAAGAGR
jgi:hypothetical protein